ncbi:GIY-YIG nuclease family protein [Marinilabilia salmonicolor]|jgi:putative endonuclease|uniref:GIY-YIG nuclease family protein n=1 Tax=Marinilabilia salmonicolor TaxID=989 RepID=UPI000DF13257|nr:GIY-YIG nuclease family protein [Marinilabilia salmonicolor]
MHYVYILKCADQSYYTGCTQNIEDRLKKHNAGQVHFTSNRLPVILISYFAFQEKHKAFQFEKYVKSGSGIAFRNKRLI